MVKKKRVAWINTVIPAYRIKFFDLITHHDENISYIIFYGQTSGGKSAFNSSESFPFNTYKLKNLFFTKGRVFWQSGALKEVLFNNYNVIIINENIHNITSWILLLLKKFFKKQIIIFGHGTRKYKYSKFKYIKEVFRSILLKQADGLLIYTDEGKLECIKLGVPEKKIKVFYNTLDTEKLITYRESITEHDLNILTNKYNLKNKFTCLFVGRLYPGKKVDVLIEAFKLLYKENNDVALIIIGDGYIKDELKKLASNAKFIHFIDGIYDEYELSKYFLVSNITFIPAALGLVSVHSFAMKKAVITCKSAMGHGPEISYLTHLYNSFLIDELSPKSIKSSLLHLINNSSLMSKLNEGAGITAEKYSISRSVKIINKSIGEL